MHYLSVRVSCRFPCFKLQSEAEVGDAGRQVVLQQHVLTLDVPEGGHQEARRTASVLHSGHFHTDRRHTDGQASGQTDRRFQVSPTCGRWTACVRPCVPGCPRAGRPGRGPPSEQCGTARSTTPRWPSGSRSASPEGAETRQAELKDNKQ